MTKGIAGKDCIFLPVTWNSYSSFVDLKMEPITYIPLVRDITVPLSFFAAPVPAIGVDTVVTYAPTLIEPRRITATFILQSKQIGIKQLFPFTKRDRYGLPPFYPFALILLLRNTSPPPPFKGLTIREAIVTSWEIAVGQNQTNLTMSWSFNTANVEPYTEAFLGSVETNDEFVTIRNLSVDFYGETPITIPPDGITQLSLRIEVNTGWVHRIQQMDERWALDAGIHSWTVTANIQLTPDAVGWLTPYLERNKRLGKFICSFNFMPTSDEAKPLTIDLLPEVSFITGSASARVNSSLSTEIRIAATDFAVR